MCRNVCFCSSLDSAAIEAHNIRKTSSDTNLSRFRQLGSGPLTKATKGSGKRKLSVGSRACGKITGQVKKQLKKPIESVKGHLGVPKSVHQSPELHPPLPPQQVKGKSLLSGLKKPFKQIKKQVSEKSGSNFSNSSEEPSPTAFQKKPSLTKSLKDFKDSLTAGVVPGGTNGGKEFIFNF